MRCFIVQTVRLLVYVAQTRVVPLERLKENDLIVTQPGNIFSGDFDFVKKVLFLNS